MTRDWKRTVAVEDVERVDRHGCDGARSPVSGISRLAWDVVGTMRCDAMRCSSEEVRAELPCGGWPGAGRAPGQVPRYRDCRDHGPRLTSKAPPPPVLVTATATPTPTPTRSTPSSQFRDRTAHQSMASIGAYPGPPSCISRDLSGLAFSPIGPGYADLSGCCVSLFGRDGLHCDHHPNSATTRRRVLVCCADFIASISIFLQLRLCAGLRHLSHGENIEALHTPRKHGPERRSGAAPAGPSPPDDCWRTSKGPGAAPFDVIPTTVGRPNHTLQRPVTGPQASLSPTGRNCS